MARSDLLADASPATDPEILSDPLRHQALTVLREHDGSITVADLATDIVESKTSKNTDRDYEAVRQCQLRLHHTHLPKLAAAGLVRFDPEARTATCPDSRPVGASSTAAPVDVEQ